MRERRAVFGIHEAQDVFAVRPAPNESLLLGDAPAHERQQLKRNFFAIATRLQHGSAKDRRALALNVLLHKLPQVIDHRHRVQIAFALRFAPREQPVATEHDAVAARVVLHGVAHHYRQLKAWALPRDPHQPVLEVAIELLHLFFAVGRGGHRDSPVGMEMIHMAVGKKAVQWCIDGRHRWIHAEGAERVQLHHSVLFRHAAVARFDGQQLVEVERRKTGALNAAQIAAAALDPQHLDGLAGQRIALRDLGTGIAAGEVGDAQIGSEQVGAVAQQLRLIESSSRLFIPQILQVAERG